MSRSTDTRRGRGRAPSRTPVRPTRRPDPARRRDAIRAGAIVLLVVAGLVTLFLVYKSSSEPSASDGTTSATQGSSQYPFAVGNPGPGERAPGFELASSLGGTISLEDYRGKNVLVYFQEGLMCQPCWDQITDLERNAEKVKAAGVDTIVSITTDPVDLIARKTQDEGITTPVLSDPDLAVSRAYEANKYGMMGEDRDGHSFLLVGPDGTIRWRADYGGAPKYTMFLPTEALLADLTAGRSKP
ncbi:peroxiredoxin family protein [Prauserella oleivorans]|uniref:Peroxiredoxin family protein n=1 Tax=Prauserella oleivorans TaxID=1478153 RepID=A0ABW5WAX7_9PSEU